MALASSRQAKLPSLPVIQQNDPIGTCSALDIVIPSLTTWRNIHLNHYLWTLKIYIWGQLPGFIDILGKKIDHADEQLARPSSLQSNWHPQLHSYISSPKERLAEIGSTRSQGYPASNYFKIYILHILIIYIYLFLEEAARFKMLRVYLSISVFTVLLWKATARVSETFPSPRFQGWLLTSRMCGQKSRRSISWWWRPNLIWLLKFHRCPTLTLMIKLVLQVSCIATLTAYNIWSF